MTAPTASLTSQNANTTAQNSNWTIMVYISADNVLANFAIESLKQLKRAAGGGESQDPNGPPTPRIVVAAQLDASGNHPVRRYAFDGSGDKNSLLEENKIDIEDPQPSPTGIADPKNLTDFIKWASTKSTSSNDRRCLILWGHGYELLIDEDQPGNAGADGRNYLTPTNLKAALEEAKLSRKLDIIGIDACAMSSSSWRPCYSLTLTT